MPKYPHHKYEIVSKNPMVYVWHHSEGVIECTITGCDFNKHVSLLDNKTGENFSYKWGYVYNTYEDAVANSEYIYKEDCDMYKLLPDCINVWKLLLSNKDYSLYNKWKRKSESSATEWYVATGMQNYYDSKHFTTLKAALKYFSLLDENVEEWADLGEQNTQIGSVIELEKGVVYTGGSKGRKGRMLSSFHLGRVQTYKQWRK